MASPSQIRRVEGGGWSKSNRFYDGSTKIDTPGPGQSQARTAPMPPPAAAARAPYNLPSLFSEHAQGPVYAKEFESPKHQMTAGGGMPHPSKDRTAWMIGTTKNDLAYYSNIAGNMGPAFYTPSISQTVESSPRSVFSKNRRFDSLTHRYISKEHNLANLCSASPGPKYSPKHSHMDLTTRYAPEYSFGGRNVADRSAFIHGSIGPGGHMYTARPATSDPLTNVGPAQYQVRNQITEPSSPRPVWGHADRFATANKIFISKRHGRAMVGGHSPGPKYCPTNSDIAQNLKQQGKPANVPQGKWCP